MDTLESLKKMSKSGVEFWHARQIMPNLGYTEWENFENVIAKAVAACEGARVPVRANFREVTTHVMRKSGGKYPVSDWALTRFACYLVCMNGDPTRKQEIADAQAYFAVKTREQELTDQLPEIERRKQLRERVRTSVKKLGDAAKDSGVKNYGRFHNSGYDGFYGMGLKQIRALKGIAEDEEFLDCIGRAELAANEFKNTQTELRLRREGVNREDVACETHRNVGQKVRQLMKDEGGKYPEELPREESLKAIESRQRKKPD